MKNAFVCATLCVLILIGCAEEQVKTVPELPDTPERVVVVQDSTDTQVRPVVEKAQTAKEALDATMENAYDGDYTITYATSSNINNSPTSGEVTDYVSAKGYRSDYRDTVQGQTYQGRSVMTEEGFFDCHKQQEWFCVSFPKPEEQPNPGDMPNGVPEGMPEPEITKLPDRTIAGITTRCFNLKFDARFSQDLCYTDDAILLSMKMTTPEGSSQMTATRLTRSVASGAYDLPAEPVPIEDLEQE